eukprot:gene38463-51965_t
MDLAALGHGTSPVFLVGPHVAPIEAPRNRVVGFVAFCRETALKALQPTELEVNARFADTGPIQDPGRSRRDSRGPHRARAPCPCREMAPSATSPILRSW